MGSLGIWIQQVPLGPYLEQHSQRAGGKGGAQPGSVTQLAACLPVLRCVGPIREGSFLSLQNIMHPPFPPLCSSLCPPGPVSRTAAMSGADSLGACERTTCSYRSACRFLPASAPPAPASNRSHIKPRFSLCSMLRAHCERHVSLQLVRPSRLVLLLLEPPLLPINLLSLCAPASALPALTLTLSIDVGVHGR